MKMFQTKIVGQLSVALFGASFLLLCLACNSKKSASVPGDADSDSQASQIGKATFSAVIDGAAVSGGAIDGLQLNNAAHIVPAENGGASTLRLWLFDTKTPDDQDFTHSVRIEVPNKVGANPATHITANIILSKDKSARYYSNEASVTITSISASRVTGTFSGKFRNSPDTPNVPKTEITITDGKFDVPIATNKVYPT